MIDDDEDQSGSNEQSNSGSNNIEESEDEEEGAEENEELIDYKKQLFEMEAEESGLKIEKTFFLNYFHLVFF